MTDGARAYPLIVFALALLCAAFILFSPQSLADGDSFMHIAAGSWMLEHGAVLRRDPFSLTMAGHPWVAHEWLAELLMALAWRAGGLAGLLMPFACALGGTVLILGAALRRWMDPLPAAVTLLGIVYCTIPSLLARPHLLVLPIMAAWAVALLRARAEARGPRLAVAALMLAWVNLHGSFIFGLAFACAMAGEAWLLGPAGARTGIARRWGAFLLASLAASLANPHGVAALLLPFQLLGVASLSAVQEWGPINFGSQQPLMAVLLALLYLGLVYAPRLPRLRVALLLALLYSALTHTRNQLLFGVFGLLLIAEPLGRALRHAPRAPGEPQGAMRPTRGAWAALALGLLLLCGVRAARPVPLPDSSTRPIAALAHLPASLKAQPVLNAFSFGAWLIFEGIPPYIDSRVELYGNAPLAAYRAMVRPSHALLQAALAAHHIGWTIFETGTPAAEMMDMLPGWTRLYADATAVVHVRTPP